MSFQQDLWGGMRRCQGDTAWQYVPQQVASKAVERSNSDLQVDIAKSAKVGMRTISKIGILHAWLVLAEIV